MSGRYSGRMYADSDRYKHFRMDADDAEYAGFDEDMRYVEVRYDGPDYTDDDGCLTVDEIVMPGLHLEAMDEDSVWMDVGGLHVWFRAMRVKGRRQIRLVVTCEPNACTPYVVTPEEAKRLRLLAAVPEHAVRDGGEG